MKKIFVSAVFFFLIVLMGCSDNVDHNNQELGPYDPTLADIVEPVTGTCDPTFTLRDVTTVIDAEMMDMQTGVPIADSSAVVTEDGKVRLYFTANGQGVSSAISDDGIYFTLEDGLRLPEGYAMVQAYALDDGSVRLFVSCMQGLCSAISDNGTDFTIEDGVRISNDDADVGTLAWMSVIALDDSMYKGYFFPFPGGGIDGSHEIISGRKIYSATSTNLLDWTIDDGVLLGEGSGFIEDSVEQPGALVVDGKVVVFYFSAEVQRMYYSVATDAEGTLFEEQCLLPGGVNGANPLALDDGTFLLYTDTHSEEEGFTISVGVLEIEE